MTLEAGLTALDELEWDLGGIRLPSDAGGVYGIVGDDGLDGITTTTADLPGSADADFPGRQRIGGRAVTLSLSLLAPGIDDATRATAMATALHDLGLVVNPMADRIGGMRMLRWRRRGEVARRLYYRPANGAALKVPSNEARLRYDAADIEVHLDCPDPVIVSDEYTDYVFVGGDTQTITNNGTLASLAPSLGYSISGSVAVVVENLTHGGLVLYPCPSGGLSVSRRHEVKATGIYGQFFGPSWSRFVDPLVLYPGDNSIRASAACTIRKWDTW